MADLRPGPSAWLAVLVTALAASGAHGSEPAGVERVLASFRTQESLTGFMMVRPQRCIDLSAADRVCAWHLGNRYSSWAPLAKAVDTDARVNVICRVPVDGGEREPGSCDAYPSRTNRASYRVPPGKRRGRARPDSRSRKALRERASDALSRARDLEALVDLLGDLPVDCFGEMGGERSCVWHLDKRTLGHGTAAAAAGVPFHKKLRFACSFDASWKLRSACTTAVGY